MKVSNGVAALELNIQGFILHPTLIWDDKEAVLVDTGMPGQLEPIRTAMNDLGVPFEKLKAVIVSHQDIDHIGSLPEVVDASTNKINVYAHELDKSYIEGEFPLIKTDPERMNKEAWASLPKEMQLLYMNPPKCKINQTLEDRHELPYCGGIQVIHTPGHTPGHISLYVKNGKTLVAGDAMICVDGSLEGPVERTTLNMNEALTSLEKYLDFDIESVICYHGGTCMNAPKEQIQNLAERVEL
ncbi:MBL fold metallo-hydrolase [Bacillus sp. 123MFChir2]|uniref:MBL fold metallo-hydrolase n=1 Tax=Bacillus sp. 123MFChir2 TaxID=1169144 RepID=UPI000368DDBB|nr:MBL fold metallo-hydrolase [Bacillus sp. 123MFChir2]